eukprot:11199713-Lingulodinium_polyedra.AAC.1
MREATREIVGSEDEEVCRQRYLFATVLFKLEGEKELVMKTGSGGLMGDPFVVYNFVHSYKKPVRDWQMDLAVMDPDCGL